MSKITRETAYATTIGDALLLIHHDRPWDNGLTMGGDLIVHLASAHWLADQIHQAVDDWSAPDVDRHMPPYHFLVYTRGCEHGDRINVNVQNLRDPAASRGQVYALSGVSPAAAMKIVAQLRTLKPQ